MPGEQLDMTKEEMEKITEALKKEEFRKLLADYAEELADPEKRKLYEDELTTLESQRGVDMKFIKPTPGFVIKMNDSEAKKAFINVCSSPEIAPPEFQYAEKKSGGDKVEKGQQCSLPYSLSPSHVEKDNKDMECDVFDVVFNPEVITRCSHPKFKDMVVETAIDGVCNNFKVTLDRGSKKFPKMKFKGTPSSCVIRKRVGEEEPDAFDHLGGRPAFPEVPGEKEKKKEKKLSKAEEEKKKKPSDEPEYKIVFREDVNMGNFTNDRVSSGGRPTQTVVTFSLPLHASARDVNLDVYADFLELHSKHYNLNHLNLPYKVDCDNGKAKFDKEKRELVVTLDVLLQEINKEDYSNFPESNLVEELPEPTESSLVEELPEPTESSLVEELPGPSEPHDQTESSDSNNLPDSEPSTISEEPSVTENTTTYVEGPSLAAVSSISVEQTVQENGIEHNLQSAVNDIDIASSSEVSSIEIVPSIDSCNSEMSDTSSTETNLEHIPFAPLNEVPESIEVPRCSIDPENMVETSSTPDNSFKPISPETPDQSPPSTPSAQSSPTNGSSDDSEVAKITEVKITFSEDKETSEAPKKPARFRSRFNVSPVPCSATLCNYGDPKNCKEPNCRAIREAEKNDFENRDLTIVDEGGSINSGLSSYTDCTLEDNLSVGIRVFQDMSTATVLFDTVYNSVPEVKLSGKKVWLENEDVSLYLILPHTVTTYTIDMSYDNVCFVLYKQHKSLWSAMHIGHSEDEVFPFKFITEENADWIVQSFGDPWEDDSPASITPHLSTSDSGTKITYTVGNRPCDIPMQYSPDSDGDDPTLKGILKSPHSPPPQSPRSRKVSFNEEVETFVLPSKRSLKGKRRRKNKNGSSSASESSDDASSPVTTSPIQEKDMLTYHKSSQEEPSNSTEGLILESAEDGWNTVTSKKNKKKTGGGKSSQSNDDKENVIHTQSEAVKILDPAGASSHKMLLGNSHIYELED